jgi:methionyl-tRNA synthetase
MGRVASVLYTAAESLRLCALLLWPVMPERMETLWRQLGWQAPERPGEGLHWGALQPGAPINQGAPLFPRLEMAEPVG